MFPQVSKVGDGYSIIPSESSSPSRRTFAAGLIMVSVPQNSQRCGSPGGRAFDSCDMNVAPQPGG